MPLVEIESIREPARTFSDDDEEEEEEEEESDFSLLSDEEDIELEFNDRYDCFFLAWCTILITQKIQ